MAGVLEKLVIMGLKIQRMPAPGQGKFGRCARGGGWGWDEEGREREKERREREGGGG